MAKQINGGRQTCLDSKWFVYLPHPQGRGA